MILYAAYANKVIKYIYTVLKLSSRAKYSASIKLA